jgi:hypothetical protein
MPEPVGREIQRAELEGNGEEGMNRKWNISLTYEPKIEPVRKGEITQTIRIIGKSGPKREGNLISLHGWQGRPYHSSWSWRMPYKKITEAISCEIYDAGMWIDPKWFTKSSGKFWWSDLDWLAALDGIVPATGEELKQVLSAKNNLSNCCGKKAQIIRWLP